MEILQYPGPEEKRAKCGGSVGGESCGRIQVLVHVSSCSGGVMVWHNGGHATTSEEGESLMV